MRADEATLAEQANRLAIAAAWMAPAAIVSCWALMRAADAERYALGVTDSPFGWPLLIIAHVLIALPLAWTIAAIVSARAPTAVGRAAACLWILLGALTAWATVLSGPLVGRALDALEADFTLRAAVRSLWCLALTVPWTVAVVGRANAASSPQRGNRGQRISGPIALAAVTLLPAAFTRSWIESQSAAAEAAIAGGRVAQTRVLAQGLCDLGATEPLAALPPRARLRETILLLADMRAQVEQALPADASAAERIERGRLLASLGRRSQARQTLANLVAAGDAQASLLVAATWQEDQQWDESDRAYRAALQSLPVVAGAFPGSDESRLRAYFGLAYNARASGRFGQAEADYREALNVLPEHSAEIHLQLGLHHQLGGRPADARRHLALAAERGDAETRRRALAELGSLGGTLPGCWLGPTESLLNMK